MFFFPLVIHQHQTASCMGSCQGSYFQPISDEPTKS